jgi:hypothetical protein
MIASGYSVDLYCDVRSCGKHPSRSWTKTTEASYVGETWSECARQAKRDGWKLRRAPGYAICPGCAKAGHKIPKEDQPC